MHLLRSAIGWRVQVGYTLNSEQTGPNDLVEHAVMAERAGFDFLAASDHFTPWLNVQGHSPNLWPVLGAVAAKTHGIKMTSFVTCPTMRYHPAIVAQKAATVQLLSGGRFRLGLGSGENLNEHVVGQGWPHVDRRHDMLIEATQLIHRLFAGETVTHYGDHFNVAAAKLWDLPAPPPPVGIAVSGPKSCKIAGEHGDFMISVEPSTRITDPFDQNGGQGKPRVAQVLICWDEDRETAMRIAHANAPWYVLGMGALTSLATPFEFEAAAGTVTPEEIAARIPCGPDVEPIVQAVAAFADLGYEEVALFQVGGETQPGFLQWAGQELLPELQALPVAPLRQPAPEAEIPAA